MSTDILMPALSPTMTEGKLSKWLKKEGDSVSPGDVIAEIETDKAMMEVEAVDEGVIGKILVAEGTEGVAVNTPIARMNGDGEAEAPKKAEPPTKARAVATAEPASPAKQAPSPAVDTAVPEPKAAPPSDEDHFYDKTEKKTVREALRDAMAEEMRRDPDVFLMARRSRNIRAPIRSARDCLRNSGPIA